MTLFRVARSFVIVWLSWEFALSASFAAPVKLNGALTSGGNVDANFHFSADSSHLLYVADQEALSYHCAARDRLLIGKTMKTNEILRGARIVKKLPDIFGRRDELPVGLEGAKIVQIGTFEDLSLAEGGGLVIDYLPIGSDIPNRVVFGFNELGMWEMAHFQGEVR
jgi:hypothetical protein